MSLPIPSGSILVLDTMVLVHFALADRLDVLKDLLVGAECWTTQAVLEELRSGAEVHPEIAAACKADWLRTARLDTLVEMRCFATWVRRIGAGERHLGEASVLAAAELRNGIAITDDRQATKVARAYGARVHGTIWLLASACRTGKLTEVGASNLIDALRSTGARMPCSGADFPAYARRHNLL